MRSQYLRVGGLTLFIYQHPYFDDRHAFGVGAEKLRLLVWAEALVAAATVDGVMGFELEL